jgi:hypothetical protein
MYLGLRYEREINCCNEELDPSTFSQPIPFIDVSQRGDPNNFAPRFGVSWDVRGDGRTAVKGGYGVYNLPNQPNVLGAEWRAQIETSN